MAGGGNLLSKLHNQLEIDLANLTKECATELSDRL